MGDNASALDRYFGLAKYACCSRVLPLPTMPVPTIWPVALISWALKSVQLVLEETRLLRSRITPAVQTNAWFESRSEQRTAVLAYAPTTVPASFFARAVLPEFPRDPKSDI